GFEESSGLVRDRKRDGRFVGILFPALFRSDQQETGEVFRIVFDSAFEDFAVVLDSCLAARDSRRILRILCHHVLHASSGVIKRDLLNLRVLTEESSALIQGNWVRQNPVKL